MGWNGPMLLRRGWQLSPLLHAKHSPLRGLQAVVDRALKRYAKAFSNAMSTIIWELRSGEWEACKCGLEP